MTIVAGFEAALQVQDLDPDNAEAGVGAPTSGLVAGSMIMTMDGELPVQYLAPGDRILTRAGSRVLKAITVTVLRSAEMLRISASALGHDRPEADLFVAPGQPILLRDWRAKALYGRDQVMIEASRLADGEYIRMETVAEVRLFSLHFERQEVIYASGLELASADQHVTA